MNESLRSAYAGTPEFAVPALKSIINSHHQLIAVLTQPDRKSGRGRNISKSAVKQSIISANVQILQPQDVNCDASLSGLREFQLDLIIVAAYGQLFSRALLDLPRLGCINIHASLLPRWRGASPIQHAILSGDKVTGVTIMQMTSAMDAGDIWLQSTCPIDSHDTAASLHDKLAQMGGDIILKAIDMAANPAESPHPQNESEATYCNKLHKSDGLIDWNESAESIIRKIRAFFPWPGTYTFLNGRRLRIITADIGASSDYADTPGTIYQLSKADFSVVAGEGSSVRVKELVPAGGKPVSAADFSNSNQLLGQHLGH